MKVQSILEVIKSAKGEGNLKLYAAEELCKQGIECDDPMKATSILNSIYNPMKNPATAAKHAAKISGALNYNYKGDKWSPGEIEQLHELCKAEYCITKIAETLKCDVASKRTVHNKIFDLRIQVKIKKKSNCSLKNILVISIITPISYPFPSRRGSPCHRIRRRTRSV